LQKLSVNPERSGNPMKEASLEHVNVTVADSEKTAAILCDLFGWQVRWRGAAASGGHTVHVGTDSAYLAVYSPPGGKSGAPFAKGVPLNHIGIEVGDLDAIEARAIALGLKPFNHGSYDPGRRFYLFDADGIEWEIVSYR